MNVCIGMALKSTKFKDGDDDGLILYKKQRSLKTDQSLQKTGD